MIPRSIRLSGFLSYRSPVELDFTGFSLACISGSNGAGKSTLLDAITWSLFGQARKRDDSIINLSPDVIAAEVIFEFEYEQNIYRVQRTAHREKTNQLEFQMQQTSQDGALVWKPLTESTQRETQKRIEQILRMDYETFTNASFFLQGQADMFTQQRSADRKRILGNILGLESWEVYRQGAADRRKAVEYQVTTLQGRLKEIAAELAEESNRKERLLELEAELQRQVETRQVQESYLESLRKSIAALEEQRRLVQALQRQVEAAAQRLHDLQQRLEQRHAERAAFADLLERSTQVQQDYAAWQAARSRLSRWEEIAENYRQVERRLQEPRAEIVAARSRLEQELESLAARKQEVDQSRLRLPEVRLSLAQAQKAGQEAEAHLKHREELEKQRDQARLQLAEARAENPRLRLEMEELKAHLEVLDSPGEALCPLCGQVLAEIERQSLVASLELQGREKGDRFRHNRLLLEQADQQVTDLDQQIMSLSHAQASFLAATRSVEQLTAQQSQLESLCQSWEETAGIRFEQVQETLQTEAYAPDARNRVSALEVQLLALGYDPQAHEQDRKAEADGRQSELDLRELEKAQASMTPLEREVQDLSAQVEKARDEWEMQQQEHSAAAAGLAEAESQMPDTQSLEQQLFQSQERENQLRMEVGAARQKVEVLADLKTRRKSLEAEREQLDIQIARYRQLENAFGKNGVPALLIEQALPQIEARANHVLDRLSGGSMNVRFITQAAYKDKRREDMRETLDIEISDASGSRDYEMYSGGEAFRVNFAIRLALSEVLAQRAGARLQMLVIDEGFGSQDAQGRQRLIEAINLVKADFDTILVITHIEELKDAFPTRIEVEKTHEGSLLRVV